MIIPESVAQSVSPDIVREIFKHFATGLKVLCDGSTGQFPWHLGHICSTWRAVFLSMHHEFWSEIQLVQPFPESEERFTQIAEFFLKHGQNFPISFKFLEDIPFLPVLRILMAQSERWQDASFHSLHSNTLLSVKNRLPLLRSLTIKDIGNIEEPDVFKDAPNLTRLTLTTISKLNFNWPSLVILELTSARICRHFVHVLSQMESLEKLLVEQENSDFLDDAHDLAGIGIILPRLKVLATVGFMFGLLLVIKTPVLEELYIDTIRLADQEPLAYGVWLSILEKSPCDRLNRLTIRTCDDMLVEDVLHYTPHVQFLTVILSDGVGDDLFDCLTCSQGIAPLLPVMQQLCMYCLATPTYVAVDELQVMVESRTNSINQCFKELVLVFVDPDMLASFSEAVQPICDSNHVQFRAEVFDEDEDLALSFLHGG